MVLDAEARPARTDACIGCGADLKVCLNCKFHDRGAYNSCREPQAERVVDKDRANFCDFFKFRESRGPDETEGRGSGANAEDPMKKLRELFKDS